MEKIGKMYTLERIRKDHQETKRPLSLQEILPLLDCWGDVALVAALMEYQPSTIRNWIHKGKIKARKGPDDRWCIPLKQFRDLWAIDDAVKYSKRFSRAANPTRVGRVATP